MFVDEPFGNSEFVIFADFADNSGGRVKVLHKCTSLCCRNSMQQIVQTRFYCNHIYYLQFNYVVSVLSIDC